MDPRNLIQQQFILVDSSNPIMVLLTNCDIGYFRHKLSEHLASISYDRLDEDSHSQS